MPTTPSRPLRARRSSRRRRRITWRRTSSPPPGRQRIAPRGRRRLHQRTSRRRMDSRPGWRRWILHSIRLLLRRLGRRARRGVRLIRGRVGSQVRNVLVRSWKALGRGVVVTWMARPEVASEPASGGAWGLLMDDAAAGSARKEVTKARSLWSLTSGALWLVGRLGKRILGY